MHTCRTFNNKEFRAVGHQSLASPCSPLVAAAPPAEEPVQRQRGGDRRSKDPYSSREMTEPAARIRVVSSADPEAVSHNVYRFPLGASKHSAGNRFRNRGSARRCYETSGTAGERRYGRKHGQCAHQAPQTEGQSG